MKSVDVTIEVATVDDLEQVVTCWMDLVSSQQEYGAHIDAATNEAPARDVLARYISQDDLLVARPERALRGGVEPILGFVMFHLEHGLFEQEEKRGIIENLYVVPGYRGQGIGSTLMNHAEAALERQGADVLAVSALEANDNARRLYERRGYSPHRLTYERDVTDSPE